MKKRNKPEASPDGSMSISGHLKEMRNRVVVCVIVFVAGFCLCLAFADRLIGILTDMGRVYGYNFIATAPTDSLMAQLSMSLVGSLVLSAPVLVYHIYAFCSPGLKEKERRYIKIGLAAGTVFFVIGVTFARLVSVPFMLRFLIGLSKRVDVVHMNSIREFIRFLLTVFVIFGVVFEMPVVTSILTMLGVLKAEWLKKGRKIMIVAIFFLAAVITPPDVISQILVAVPMLLLYEVSILLSRLLAPKKKASAEEETEDD